MDSLLNNHTWDLVTRPQDNNIMKFQRVYKTKFNSAGAIEWHLVWYRTTYLSKKASTTLKPFPLLQIQTLSD